MKCEICKEDVGYIQVIEDVRYCEDCLKQTWDIRKNSQYYKKLFLKCPFCDVEIDITDDIPITCRNCNVKIKKPNYCGFCEDSFVFRTRFSK